MKVKKYDLKNKNVQFLMNTDKQLELLIKHLKTCQILIEEDDFKCIVKYIIGQQISDKTREAIWQKVCKKYKQVSPKTMIKANEEELKDLGICKPKITYIQNLSSAILNKQIDFKIIRKLDNQEIKKQLTKIKGIGNWTVEMYLIFSLGRENVLSNGDNTIKRVLKWMYNMKDLPNSKDVTKLFAKWSNYSTIVSAYFWEAIARNTTSQNINEL